jgi:hypothetical protein
MSAKTKKVKRFLNERVLAHLFAVYTPERSHNIFVAAKENHVKLHRD